MNMNTAPRPRPRCSNKATNFNSSKMQQETSTKMTKIHIVNKKRFPKIYKLAARVLIDVNSSEISIKSALRASNVTRGFYERVYRIVLGVLENKQLIWNIISFTNILKKVPALKQEATEIMIHEMIIKEGELPGESKPVLLMRKYSKQLKEALRIVQQPIHPSPLKTDLPKYARIHTISTSVSKVLADLEKERYERVHYDEEISYDDYEKLILGLQSRQFVVDFHFKDLLVFPSGENLSKCFVYKTGKLFLQDKANYVPVHVLAPEPGSTVLDACAAPGIKTCQLASMMKNKGSIYAFDEDCVRFDRMIDILKKGNVEICTAAQSDFTALDPHKASFSSVEYILLDPSCSRSGMIGWMGKVTDDENIERIQKLARYQIVLLKHALSFPNVKRVVYSTCSTTEEENEYVVEEAIKCYGETFKIVPAMPEWPVRGSSEYPHGNLCFRAVPGQNLTNGVFVAVFERRQTGQNMQKKRKAFSDTVQVKSGLMKRNEFHSLQGKKIKPKSDNKQARVSFSGKQNKKSLSSENVKANFSKNTNQESDITDTKKCLSSQTNEFIPKSVNMSLITPPSGKKNKKLRLSQGLRNEISKNVKHDSDLIEAKKNFSPQNKEVKTPGSGKKNKKLRLSQGLGNEISKNVKHDSDLIEAKKYFSPQNKEIKTPGSGKKNKKLRLSQGSPQIVEVNSGCDILDATPSSGKKIKKLSLSQDIKINEYSSPQTKELKSKGDITPAVTPSSGKKNKLRTSQGDRKIECIETPQTKDVKTKSNILYVTPGSGKKNRKLRLSHGSAETKEVNSKCDSSFQPEESKSKGDFTLAVTSSSGKKNKFRISQGDQAIRIETKEDVSPQAKGLEPSNVNKPIVTPSSGKKGDKLRLSQGEIHLNELFDCFSPQIKTDNKRVVTPSSGKNKKLRLSSENEFPENVEKGLDFAEESSSIQSKKSIVKSNKKPVKTPMALRKNKKLSVAPAGNEELVSPQTREPMKKSPRRILRSGKKMFN